jgi:hypothetical protein
VIVLAGAVVELILLIALYVTALGAFDDSMGDPCLEQTAPSFRHYETCKTAYEYAFWITLGGLAVVPIMSVGIAFTVAIRDDRTRLSS